MKEGWKYKKLGEVCSYHKEQGKYANLCYIGMEHIESGTGKLIGTINSECVQSSSFKFNKGEILYGRLRPYLKKVYVAEFDGCCSTEIFPISSNVIEAGFLKYWFLSDKITNEINKTAAGCRMPRGNMNEVKQFLIGFPEDKKEQRSIVARLDAAFAGIDALKANAERQFDEAVIFYRKALTEAMTPKKGWNKKLLQEIATIRIGPFGSLIHKKDHVPGCVPLVNPIHMRNGIIEREAYFTISEEKAKELSAYRLKAGDIVVARRGEIGRCAIVTNEEDGFICGTGSMIVRFNNPQRINSRFMLRLFQSPAVREYLFENAVGATMQNINAEIVSNLPVAFPSYDEQIRIVTYLDKIATDIDKFGDIQRKTLLECDALKQAMLKEVFE